MTSLSTQLKKLKKAPTRALAVERDYSSLLFNKKEAGSYDKDDFYKIGLAGLAGMKKLDDNFDTYLPELFEKKLIKFNRAIISKEENTEFDQKIEKMLLLLSPYFHHQCCREVLEWFIHKFQIHSYNAEALFLTFLPFHSINSFGRLLHILKFNSPDMNWLEEYQKDAAPIPLNILCRFCQSGRDYWLITCLNKFVVNFVEILEEKHINNMQHYFTFLASLYGNLIENRGSTIDDQLISRLIPFIGISLKSILHLINDFDLFQLSDLLLKLMSKYEMVAFLSLFWRILIEQIISEKTSVDSKNFFTEFLITLFDLHRLSDKQAEAAFDLFLDFIEGDLELADWQAEKIQKYFEDQLMFSHDENKRIKRKVGKRWDKSRPISYDFADNVPEQSRQRIRQALAVWESETCLSFVENGPDVDRLEFFDGGGCSSFVGKTGGTQGISISTPGCDFIGIIAHEIGHALGTFHEQARPDQSRHIAIHYNNIPLTRWNNFQPVNEDQAETFKLPYDPGSVMHYGPYGFASDQYKPTISTLDINWQSTIGQRIGPSFLDILSINKAYFCSEKCSKPLINCLHGGYPNPNKCFECKCPHGFSGKLCELVQPSPCGATLKKPNSTKETTLEPTTLKINKEKETATKTIEPPTTTGTAENFIENTTEGKELVFFGRVAVLVYFLIKLTVI
uniref:Metalloendopeptidase n=1 Tax=Meloidogyne javanica TaxID=6303 RepID=A0A915MG45_MELJA